MNVLNCCCQKRELALHAPNSPLLCGIVDESAGDKITVRKVESLKDKQVSLFEL